MFKPISIHALREEGDGAASMRFPLRAYFYPRPPRGGRRFVEFFIGKLAEFLSTPSARRATKAQDLKRAIELISIHALREEGDVKASVHLQTAYISIHALREEGDPEPDSCDCEFVVFLSTPSARRATELHSFRQGQSEISIHALREEGDSKSLCRRRSPM